MSAWSCFTCRFYGNPCNPQPGETSCLMYEATVTGEPPRSSPEAGHGAEAPEQGTKDTNPKDLLGSKKLPLDLVPPGTLAYASIGHLNGALKYGAWNWRVAGIRMSIYTAALLRHAERLNAGEDCDPEDGVPHLAAILACAGIIIDAKHCGKLTDDRGPAVDIDEMFSELTPHVARLQELHRDRKPRHWSIHDTREE